VAVPQVTPKSNVAPLKVNRVEPDAPPGINKIAALPKVFAVTVAILCYRHVVVYIGNNDGYRTPILLKGSYRLLAQSNTGLG
jgi:hypothetical protein